MPAFCRTAVVLGLAIAISPQPVRAIGIVRWSANGAALCTATGNQQNPQIVPDGAGGAIATWQDGRSGGSDIYAQRVRADGTADPSWPAQGVALCTAALNQTIPQIVTDGAGGAIVTWQDLRSGTPAIYAQRVRAGGTVDPGWPANGIAVGAGAAGAQAFPQIASDGAGGAIVTWQDERNGNPDICAQRIRANGTADPLWPAAGVALCTASRAQSSPHVVSDGASGAIVAWADSRNSGGGSDIPDIYALRVLSTGTVDPAWPANGVAICIVFGTQLDPQIAPDGAGGAIVTWYDRRSGQPADPIYQDIFAQRVSSAGAQLWTAGGVAVCTAVSTQLNQQVVPDGAGGAIVTWQDARGGNTYDIYAHHVRANGSLDPDLPAQGTALCTAAGNQEAPQIVADGAGGAIVAWQDARGGSTYDVYAQRMLADGTIAPGWAIDGIFLCAAANSQLKPQIVWDAAGGAIVAWQDARPAGLNQNDIYAQRASDNLCGVESPYGGLSLLQACGAVDWTNASGGPFFDAVNWNRALGPAPSGTCPADCLPYDARFGIGGATYGVTFAGNPATAEITVEAGDHPSFDLAGNTYSMNRLAIGAAGSGLTLLGGAVAVHGGITVGGPGGVLDVDQGCAVCATSVRAGDGSQVRTPAAAVVVAGGALAHCPVPQPGAAVLGSTGGVFSDTLVLAAGATVDSVVLGTGGVMFSAAPVSFDLANSGTLSPGSDPDGVGSFTVQASYTQTSGGRLVVDLGGDLPGSGYDVLRVAGPATLGGSLEWKLVDGYLPAIGERFEVLVAHPLIGTFDSVREDIDVVYTDTSVVLIATATTPVLASFVNAETEPGRVHLRWHVGGRGGPVTIRRDRGTGAWDAVATRFPDGTGMVEYEDTQVSAGRYGYRLGLASDALEIAAGEVWLEVPAASRFALAGASPNPSHGPLTVSFSLDDTRPARLELFDLAGRLVESRAVESPRPGGRVLTLGAGPELPPGVYQLSLSQGVRRASCRVVIVR